MHPTVPVTTIFPKMPELSKERRGVSNDGYDISVAQPRAPRVGRCLESPAELLFQRRAGKS